ncbi:MAG: glycosyl transferase [Cyanobacteria bacterium RYN_339]|nr:glycosyl transferase [Cyanobacteria bacterium RYN_339]
MVTELELHVPPARPAAGSYIKRHVLELALPLVALGDGALIAGNFLFFYFARFVWGVLQPAPAPALAPYLHASLLVALIWTASLALVGLYDARRAPSRFDDLMLTLAGLGLGATLSAGLASFYRSFSYSRLVFAYAFFGSLATLLLVHLALRAWQAAGLRRGWGVTTTLVVGANEVARKVAQRLGSRARLGRVVKGVVAMPGEDATGALGREADLIRLLDEHAVDELVIAWPGAHADELGALVRRATAARAVNVQIAPGILEGMTFQLEVSDLAGMPMLALREVALRKWRNRAVKRAMDVGLASLALVAGLPVLGVLALAVKLSSPGPVFYAQERLGRDGHLFTIYKFRSMPVDAEASGPVWTSQGDLRATPVGALLRRFSLDELPQLWNVITGDMSLVGPRPERPFFVAQFQDQVPRYMDRHLVRSGLTGWAQVNGLRGDVDITDRTRFDIHYVENWSVLLDLRIMFMTLAAIFRRPGY